MRLQNQASAARDSTDYFEWGDICQYLAPRRKLRSFNLSVIPPHIRLARSQGNHSSVAGIGDSDNSLSVRWAKSGARASMNHAAGAGTGWH